MYGKRSRKDRVEEGCLRDHRGDDAASQEDRVTEMGTERTA